MTRSTTWLLTILLSLTCLPLHVLAQSSVDPLPTVLGSERSAELDSLVMRSGELRHGSVLNPTFTLMSALGPLTLSAETIAGLDLSDRTTGLTTVHLVNGNTLTGFLSAASIEVVLDSGASAQLPVELLDSVVFAIRDGERRDLPLGHAVVLSSGEVITAALGIDELSISTNEGAVPLALPSLQQLEFAMHEGRLVLATARLTDGRVLEGVISPAVLPFTLDTGGEVALHQSRIQTLYTSAGTPLEQLGLVTSRREYTGALTTDDAVWTNGRYADEYTFFVREGSTVVVDMTVDSFDNFVQLESPTGRQWQNDDHGSTRRSYLEVTADTTGLWRTRATSLSGGRTGAYRLVIDIL